MLLHQGLGQDGLCEVTDPEITSLWKVLLMELEPLKGLWV